ncbi:hypothetical protein D3C72_1560430 [compost metagenome]
MSGRTQQVFRARDAMRRVPGDVLRVGLGRCIELVSRGGPRDDAPGQCMAGGEGVVPQQQIQRAPGAQHPHEPMRHSGVRRGAELEIRGHEARARICDGEIASQHQR